MRCMKVVLPEPASFTSAITCMGETQCKQHFLPAMPTQTMATGGLVAIMLPDLRKLCSSLGDSTKQPVAGTFSKSVNVSDLRWSLLIPPLHASLSAFIGLYSVNDKTSMDRRDELEQANLGVSIRLS